MKNWNEYTPFEWLLIDAASRFGLDKQVNHERIEWAVTNLLPFIKAARDTEHLGVLLTPYIDNADDPAMFCGACIALWDAIEGNVSTWQVGQDAASSGPQLLSLLLKDTIGMSYTGTIDTGSVPDVYTAVTKVMNETRTSASAQFERSRVKKGIIPHVYASEAAPKRVFGKDYSHFLKSYKQVLLKAQEASDFMVAAWNPHATAHRWVMPDGAEVVVPVIVSQQKTLKAGKYSFEYIFDVIGHKKKGEDGTKSLSANITHSYDAFILRELNRRCNYDPQLIARCIRLVQRAMTDRAYKPQIDMATDRLLQLQELWYEFGQVSAVAFEYMDEANVFHLSSGYLQELNGLLASMSLHDPFEITNIHDEFKCLPGNVRRMKTVYNQLMANTYESDWWFATMKRLTGQDVRFMGNIVDPQVIPQILKATYAIG